MTLPVSDIEHLIPQRHPFVMVDALLEYSESALQAAYTVPPSNLLVADGYFQASGVLEHQAQSVALHTGYQFFLAGKSAPLGYIGAVKSFNINRLPKINEKLLTKIEIMAEMDGVTLVKTETKIGEETIAASEMKTVIA